MENKELQIENGNFTRIINPLIEALIKIPFKGCELNVALFLIRKTYGFNKTEDSISLSQIEEGVNRSRPTVVLALKNLQLVKVAILVKQGNAKKVSNIWKINKYFDTWELVKLPQLVKHKRGTSKGSFTTTSKGSFTDKRQSKDIRQKTKQFKKLFGNYEEITNISNG